jgi:anti-sigma factor RsiW
MMTKTTRLSPREWEALSAYLDGQLGAGERASLEARLQTNADLQVALEQLRQTRTMLRSVPRQKVPRNYTLTPQMVGARQPAMPRAYPILRLVSALTTILFVLVLLGDFLRPRGSMAPALEVARLEATATATTGAEFQSAPVEEIDATSPESGTAVEPLEQPQARKAAPVAPEMEGYPATALSESLTNTQQVQGEAQPYPAPLSEPSDLQLKAAEKPLEESSPAYPAADVPNQASGSEPAEPPASSQHRQPYFWNNYRFLEIFLAAVAIGTTLAVFLIRRRSGN